MHWLHSSWRACVDDDWSITISLCDCSEVLRGRDVILVTQIYGKAALTNCTIVAIHVLTSTIAAEAAAIEMAGSHLVTVTCSIK